MQHYKLNLEDGSFATMTLDENVTTIEREILKLGNVITKSSVEGDPKSPDVSVKILSYEFIS